MSEFEQLEKNMDAGKIEFDDEHALMLKMTWKRVMGDYTWVNIPKGWVELVECMLQELAKLRGRKRIGMIAAEWGSLEADVWITRPGGKVFLPCEIVQKYRVQSQRTCYECGNAGCRAIIRGQIRVVCRACYGMVESNGDKKRTGTWLDEV